MTTRREIYSNPSAQSWRSQISYSDAITFHRNLPYYSATKLHSLDAIAQEIGVKNVFVKDETNRFGLPSFKILGASWAIHKVLSEKEIDTSEGITLIAATDGNHGRAVARTARLLGIQSKIFVPRSLDVSIQKFIAEEGAEVVSVDGDYDATVREAASHNGILIQDTAFDDYKEIPQWIVDGYSTLMAEIDDQVQADIVVFPVGVGSLGQSVVSHCKMKGRSTTCLAVEPDTAACLYKSLKAGKSIPIRTNNTIQAGMNCGTVSDTAWPILKSGVDVSTTVSDFEVHEAIQYLHSVGIDAGPCGAAPLAAFRYVALTDPTLLRLNKDSTVVLICTEGSRDYQLPKSVSENDPIVLTQTLVKIDSSNPGLSSSKGAGEKAIAEYIASWLEHRDIEVHWIEEVVDRPSIIGVVRGSGKGKTLMFNGHIDTVTNAGYDGNPQSGDIVEGAVQGRGSLDMKSGIAASMIALARAKETKLRGDVILAAVADEENLSIGTEQVLRAGWRADGVIVAEPSLLEVILSHKGFVWIEVDIIGAAAHGSLPSAGIDAICKAGYFLVELEKHGQQLMEGPKYPLLGTGTIHAGTIHGGEEPSSYPGKCTIMIERRTVPGETNDVVEAQLRTILNSLTTTIPDFKYNLTIGFSRSPFNCPNDNPFITTALKSISKIIRNPTINGWSAWTDCALLSDAGIPAMLFGPRGAGLHSKHEFSTIESIEQVTDALTQVAIDFCC